MYPGKYPYISKWFGVNTLSWISGLEHGLSNGWTDGLV